MNTNTKNPIRITAAIALFAALTTGAYAADVPQVHVKYADLNLNTAAGATVLYQRIRAAADQVCNIPNSRDLARMSAIKACAAHALAEAVATVDNPTLTGVYDLKTGATAVVKLAAVQ